MKAKPSVANLTSEQLNVAKKVGEDAAYEALNEYIDVINQRIYVSVALLFSDHGYGQKRINRMLAQLCEIFQGYEDLGYAPKLSDQQKILEAQTAELADRGIKVNIL